METDTEGGFYFSVDGPWCKFVTNLLMMKQANMRCELPKVKSSDMLFFPRFSLRCESCETGSAPDWTLLSLTSAVISHGCWLSNNDCLSGRLSAAQNPVLSALIGTHIFAQDHIKHCSHSPLQGIMWIWVPCHRGLQGLDRRSMAASNTNMGSKIDWKNHSNTRGRPWSAASPFKARVNTSLGFSLPSFRSSPAPLFCPEQRVRGTFPGAASFTAHGPKGSRAKHKGSGHCHSPQSPTILKATFQSKMPPSLPHPAPPPADRDGSEWATMGYLQWEEPCFYLSDSQDVEHERRISSARPAGWIPEHFEMFRTKECHIFNIMNT